MSDPVAKRYCAYMLRMWRENDGEPWRAALEDPHTGERHHFASIEELALFLGDGPGRGSFEKPAVPEIDP